MIAGTEFKHRQAVIRRVLGVWAVSVNGRHVGSEYYVGDAIWLANRECDRWEAGEA